MIEIIDEGIASLASAIDAQGCMAKLEFGNGMSSSDLAMERTEDCKFSPCGKVLAFVVFAAHKLKLFKVEHQRDEAGNLSVLITGSLEVTHPILSTPHGVDFIDARTIAVANRDSCLTILGIPDVPFDGRQVEAKLLLKRYRVNWFRKIQKAGSVTVTKAGRFAYEFLVCQNYRRRISYQCVVRLGNFHFVLVGRNCLRRGMDIPDGITTCPVTGQVAISNHDEHAIRLYPNSRGLRVDSDPSGRLLGMAYPHGVRFFDKGRGILSADGGAPLIHYWTDETARWEGDREPTASFRVMDDGTFKAGQHNLREGGPKGIDIHQSGEFFVATSECLSFGVFDLPKLLEAVQNAKESRAKERLSA